ncbi:MAG: 5-(carboxyamino)imidazole ribonucleotide synthase [Bacteroidota bacterium]
MNPLQTRIGILGGGQLGRMMIEESLRLNLTFNILENDPNCPCANICDKLIVGSLQDEAAIRKLAEISDVLSYEIEHVNTEVLLKLESEGKTIIPSPKVLQIIQDKGLQKQFYLDNNIPTSSFVLVNNKNEWANALGQIKSEKFAAKTRKDGYDGKGVMLLNKSTILADFNSIPFEQACVLEEFIPCQKELSVIVARDRNGNTLCYPSVEMEFDPVANLVTFLLCPANIDKVMEAKAEEIAIHAVNALGGIGIFAVEMFLSNDNQILVNEIAPRAHNSGHHSIEACYTSQFEQLVRILANIPLGSTKSIKPAVMINLLGADDFSGPYQLEGLEEISAMEGVYVHLYGKKECKPKRKMGHITVLAESPEDAHKKAHKVSSLVSFKPNP